MTATSSEPAEKPAPANVVEALCRVANEIGGIEKLTPQQRRDRGMSASVEQGVKFAYRSIDQVTQAAQPLFARYGVVIMPILRSIKVEDIVVNGNPWTDTIVEYDWEVYGPGNTSIHGATAGIGRDNSDKGAGKAMTNAYKNLVLRLLTIGDPTEEIDREVHAADPPPIPPSAEEQERIDYEEMVWQLCKDLRDLDVKDGFYVQQLRQAAGGHQAQQILAWVRADPDAAHEVVSKLIEALKHEKDTLANPEPPNDGPPPAPARGRRAKAGSAVTPETQAAIDRAQEAFPGAEVEGD